MSPASFRDPAGRLYEHHGRLLRAVTPSGVENASLYLHSPALEPFKAAGRLIRGRVVTPAEGPDPGAALLIEHERIPFPCYPEEWAPPMLADAARLTLDLAEALLVEGLGLKDANPFNVLFAGPRAVFVDALSIERRAPLDPLWLPLAQFQRTFLLPLLATRYGQSLPQSFLRREGPEPAEIAALAGPLRRWLPPALTLATLPARLGRSRRAAASDFYTPKPAGSAEQARYVLTRLFRGLRRRLASLTPPVADSAWSDYQNEGCHYSATDQEHKEKFVGAALAAWPAPARVLDVGANLGRYSQLAAQSGHRVVAIDSDAAVVGRLWRSASAAGADILPLVLNLAEPTPARGWDNAESPAFLQRARGAFDGILLLAVVHHLVVSHRVPIEAIVDLVAGLAPHEVLVEFVAPSDPQFDRLTRGRQALHQDYTRDRFESAWARHFHSLAQVELPDSGRRLYRLRRRA